MTCFQSDLSSFNLATGEIPTLTEDRYNSVTRGYFGRINYDYAGRYLFEASGRYDGSSRFAKAHRWGFFPSAHHLGWRISEEKFFHPLRKWWDNAKLRFSAGSLGQPTSELLQLYRNNKHSFEEHEHRHP
jgi:hypothetical protein